MIKYIIKITLFIPFFLSGQNYKKDILEVTKNMADLKNYSMTIRYRLFLDDNVGKAFQERTREVRRFEKKFFYRESDGGEFLENKGYAISVNKSSKVIEVARKSETQNLDTEKGKLLNALDINLDSLLHLFASIKILNDSPKKISYELVFKPNRNIESMTLTLNKEKKIFESVRYKYKNSFEIPELKKTKHKVIFEVCFENFSVNSTVENSLFSEKKYFFIEKGKIIPAKSYEGYKLNVIN